MKPPSHIYDLSQPIFPNCPQYPDHSPRPVQVRLFYMRAVQGVNKTIGPRDAVGGMTLSVTGTEAASAA